MRRLFSALLLGAMATPQAGPKASAQEPAEKSQAKQEEPAGEVPAFTAQVDQVTVDAVVTDKKGTAFGGLTANDFTVLEDDVPQTLSYFEAVQLPAAPSGAPPPKPRVATNMGPVSRTGRTFVVVFDDVHTTRGNGERAKTAIARFLRTGVREGDHVTLVSSGGDAWWTARMEEGRSDLMAVLKRLEGRYIPDRSPDRMSDYEAMRIEVLNDQDVAARVKRRFDSTGALNSSQSSGSSMAAMSDHDPIIWGRATEVYFQAVARNRITLGTLKRVLESLAGTKGRKSVILVTDGFIEDPTLEDFKEVVKASRRANAAIYSVNSIGLAGLPVEFSAESSNPISEMDVGAAFMDESMATSGNEDLAVDTGGFAVRNSNDLARGIERIADESRVYYLLGYISTNGKLDGKFRKIDVRVNRKDVKIRARKGYYAPLEGGKEPARKDTPRADPQFQQALDSPYEINDVPMRMTAYVFGEGLMGKANATVLTEVDVRKFDFKEAEGRFTDTLEFLIVTADRDSGEFWRYDQKVNMNLLPATRDRLFLRWLPIARDFELAPGSYQSKMVVRDKNSGKVGSVTFAFDVPALTSFRASSITLSDTLQPTPQGAKGASQPVPVLLARRTFDTGSQLYAEFSIFGAAKDKATGMPKVAAGYQIRDAKGAVHTNVAPSLIRPTSLGHLSRLIGSSLKGLPAGEYDFALAVTDEISGKTLDLHEPFTVVAAEEAASASP
jgi:VWFA-related protein